MNHFLDFGFRRLMFFLANEFLSIFLVSDQIDELNIASYLFFFFLEIENPVFWFSGKSTRDYHIIFDNNIFDGLRR